MVVAALVIAFVLLLALFGLVVVMLGSQAKAAELVKLQPPRLGPPPLAATDDVEPEVTALVEAGQLSEAVQRVRELKGLSPPEARAWVDGLRAGHATLRSRTPALVMRLDEADIQREIREGRLLNAIKLYQELTGAGLKEAKDAVQALRDRMRMS
jgi:ribosomal protein L7/L12